MTLKAKDCASLQHALSEAASFATQFEIQRDEALSLAETQGRQLAAMRAVLEAVKNLAQYTEGTTFIIPGAVMKQVHAVLTETEAAAQWVRVAEWRDIKTAPKDGTIIRLADGGGVNADGWFTEERWVFLDAADIEKLLHTNTWVKGYGPTHWMPLPAAPNLSSVAEGEAGEGEGE